MSKEIVLPSGAKLAITLSPFAISKALLQAMLEEGKELKIDPKTEIDVNLFKDLFCTAFCSKKIEACVLECMKRVTYNGLKIDVNTTFEPEEARDDYMTVCYEVAKENVMPFTKTLTQQYSQILESLKKLPA